MNKYLYKLQNLIARGNLHQAFTEIFALLSDCYKSDENAEKEIAEIRNQLLQSSGTLHDIDKRFSQGLISFDASTLYKNRVRSAYISILDELPSFPLFYNFLEDLEEEDAWEEAGNEGTIAAYELYFNRYPKGRYSTETTKIIAELKENIKQKALEEKERRTILKKIIREEANKNPSSIELDISSLQPNHLQQWWQSVPPVWQKALMDEIGIIDSPQEKHLKRILKVKIIDISTNYEISNLEPLKYLKNIKTINLSNTSVENLDPLKTLTNLEHLNILNTSITSLEPLNHLSKLRSLVCNKIDAYKLQNFSQFQPNCKIKQLQ